MLLVYSTNNFGRWPTMKEKKEAKNQTYKCLPNNNNIKYEIVFQWFFFSHA